MLDEGRGLASDGQEGIPTMRAVIEGTGEPSGAHGGRCQEILGRNGTGAPNFRFAFTLKKQAPK